MVERADVAPIHRPDRDVVDGARKVGADPVQERIVRRRACRVHPGAVADECQRAGDVADVIVDPHGEQAGQ